MAATIDPKTQEKPIGQYASAFPTAAAERPDAQVQYGSWPRQMKPTDPSFPNGNAGSPPSAVKSSTSNRPEDKGASVHSRGPSAFASEAPPPVQDPSVHSRAPSAYASGAQPQEHTSRAPSAFLSGAPPQDQNSRAPSA
ncbi:hypothetical protein DIPPA_60680, partial [Diplonema papillatum]